jgi:hypothetical protein
MKAYLTICPNEKTLIDINVIMHKLWNEGINFGIKGEVIIDVLKNKIYDEPILIAEGTPSVNGEDGTIKYEKPKVEKAKLPAEKVTYWERD